MLLSESYDRAKSALAAGKKDFKRGRSEGRKDARRGADCGPRSDRWLQASDCWRDGYKDGQQSWWNRGAL